VDAHVLQRPYLGRLGFHDMQIPGPFEIYRVQDLQWDERRLDFLFRDASHEDFSRTRASRDERFVDVERALLRMSFHSLVIRTPHGNLLVDTCVGNHKHRPMLPEWHLQEFPYLDRLRRVGFTPDDIDFVCCTHLHGDHVGWNTQLDNGRWVPTFRNARYLFADSELSYWESFHATQPENMYAAVWHDSVLPVIEAGMVDRVAADHEVLPGICLRPAPGHTPGNVVIDVTDGRMNAVLGGDVLHHPVQVERPDWVPVFDDDGERAARTRRELLERIVDSDTLLLGAHFTGPGALRIRGEGDGFRYE
jgi:glyoxylase-like metal-dependent hydrolase (beta-lactamase superfamily II)